MFAERFARASGARFVMADTDTCEKPEWSTGYVPTVLLCDNGEVTEKFAGNDWGKMEAFASTPSTGGGGGSPRAVDGPTCLNGHALEDVGTNDNGWACDGRNSERGCARGCTGFYQSASWGRWRCSSCDYDLCDMCYARDAGGNCSNASSDAESDDGYIHIGYCNGSCGGRCNPDGQKPKYKHQSWCTGECGEQCNG